LRTWQRSRSSWRPRWRIACLGMPTLQQSSRLCDPPPGMPPLTPSNVQWPLEGDHSLFTSFRRHEEELPIPKFVHSNRAPRPRQPPTRARDRRGDTPKRSATPTWDPRHSTESHPWGAAPAPVSPYPRCVTDTPRAPQRGLRTTVMTMPSHS
jgi:hypothetical protein